MLAIMMMRDQEGNRLPFSITFTTASISAGTGGERITYEKAVLVGSGTSKSEQRNPDHFSNYTRLLKGEGTEELRKFRPLLVDLFNGKIPIL
jgi:hypothetical protein